MVTSHTKHLTLILLALYAGLVGVLLPVIDVFFDAEWDPALRAVPVVALAFFPAALGWSLAAVFLHESAVEKNYPAQAVGIVFAVVIGLVLAADLQAAAYLMVVREMVDLALKWLVGRPYVAWQSVLAVLAGLLGGLVLQTLVAAVTG